MDPSCEVEKMAKEEPAAQTASQEALEAAPLMEKLTVSPWGVLGTQMTGQGERAAGPSPDDATAILDPTSLAHVQGLGPRGSMGASGAIYDLVGLDREAAFPADVIADVQHENDAKHHRYGGTQVIHAVGPDLRAPELDHDEQKALEALAEAYANVLVEFVSSGCARLRLLPLSGGFFSGHYHSDMPGVTFGALGAAFARLDPKMQREVLQASSIELCIFAESEFEHFRGALRRVKRLMGVDGEGEAAPPPRRSSAPSPQSAQGRRGSEASAAARRKSSRVSFGDAGGAAGAGHSDEQPDRRSSASLEAGQRGAGEDGQPVLLGWENAASESPKGSGSFDAKGGNDATKPAADCRRRSSASSKPASADGGDDDDDVVTEMLAEDETWNPINGAPQVASVIKAAANEDPCDSGTEMLSQCGTWRRCEAAARSPGSSRPAGVDRAREEGYPSKLTREYGDRTEILSHTTGEWRPRASAAQPAVASRDGLFEAAAAAEQVRGPPPLGVDSATEVLSESGDWQQKKARAGRCPSQASVTVIHDGTEVLSQGEWRPRTSVLSAGAIRGNVAVADDGTEELSESGEWRPRARISNASALRSSVAGAEPANGTLRAAEEPSRSDEGRPARRVSSAGVACGGEAVAGDACGPRQLQGRQAAARPSVASASSRPAGDEAASPSGVARAEDGAGARDARMGGRRSRASTREAAVTSQETPAEAARRLRNECGPGASIVCILGGVEFRCADSEALVKAMAPKLMAAVAPKVKFVTGGMAGVQEAFAEHCGDGARVWNLLPEGQSSGYDRGTDVHAGADLQERRAVFGLLGDVYVTVEGGPGVSEEARAAHSRGAAVVPVMRTGGASGGLFTFPEGALQRPRYCTEEQWSLLKSKDAPVEQTASAVAAVVAQAIAGAPSAQAPEEEVPVPVGTTKRVVLDPKSHESLRSVKWRFGQDGGARVLRLGAHFPGGSELRKGDLLSHINGVDVLNRPRSEIQATWRSEQHRLPRFYLDFAPAPAAAAP